MLVAMTSSEAGRFSHLGSLCECVKHPRQGKYRYNQSHNIYNFRFVDDVSISHLDPQHGGSNIKSGKKKPN
jgi:hypothetical protein